MMGTRTICRRKWSGWMRSTGAWQAADL